MNGRIDHEGRLFLPHPVGERRADAPTRSHNHVSIPAPTGDTTMFHTFYGTERFGPGFSAFGSPGADASECDRVGDAPDHYAALGLSEAATAEEVRTAFRRAALQHHPDKGGDAATFAAAKRASETLSDPSLRAEYDAARRSASCTASGAVRGGVVPLQVTLDSLYTDSWHTISYTPRDPGAPMQTVRVCVPAGSANGARVPVRLGDDADDIVVAVVSYVRATGFSVVGRTIHTLATLSLANAVGGAPFSVRRPDRARVVVRPPEGLVLQPGSVWTVPGHGLPSCGGDSDVGALVVHISVYLPPQITRQQASVVRDTFAGDAEDLPDAPCVILQTAHRGAGIDRGGVHGAPAQRPDLQASSVSQVAECPIQ